LITASDFAQALGQGKFGNQKQLIEKKVCIEDTYKPLPRSIFFDWGNMFEDVACSIYADMHNTQVHEFGLIRHPVHAFFGASPDGITDDGIMLEIKCPLRRKINGEIPLQYYYQIQGQLDVCELDICDYLECEFSKYTDYNEYVEAYTQATKNKSSGIYTGVIKTINDSKHEYLCLQKTQCDAVGNIENNEVANSIVSYWILEKHNIIRVYKDELFVKTKLEELKHVWDKIIYYRENRNRFEIEVLRKISFETETMYPNSKISQTSNKKKKYMFVDLEDENVNKQQKTDKKKCMIVDLE
jgi:putative phage-type endonuclease